MDEGGRAPMGYSMTAWRREGGEGEGATSGQKAQQRKRNWGLLTRFGLNRWAAVRTSACSLKEQGGEASCLHLGP